MLLGILSCNTPVIKKPIDMYAISLRFQEAGTSPVNLNYKKEVETVGEWTEEVNFIPLEEAPENMMCFSIDDWLTILKPKLKEGSQFYHDKFD